MDIEYTPDRGVRIDGVEVDWAAPRADIRKRLGEKHRAADTAGQFGQKRDIYQVGTQRKAVGALTRRGHKSVPMGDGEFFFPELKMALHSAEAMGGDGPGLTYIYCGQDVSHLP